MTPELERAARALHEKLHYPFTWDESVNEPSEKGHVEWIRRLARAVIESLREPSEAAIDAINEERNRHIRDGGTDSLAIYEAIFNAILGDSK